MVDPWAIMGIVAGVVALLFTEPMARWINRYQREAFWHVKLPLWWDILGLRIVGVYMIAVGVLKLVRTIRGGR